MFQDDGIWDTPLLRDCFMSEAFDTELSENPAAANLAPRFPINGISRVLKLQSLYYLNLF